MAKTATDMEAAPRPDGDDSSTDDQSEVMLHASAIAWQDKALVFMGPAGSGKSTLCLSLMAFGATLIGDDRVIIRRSGNQLFVTAPAQIGGMVEARGIGLLGTVAPPLTDPAPLLAAVVQLGKEEPNRLPPWRETELLGLSVCEIWRVQGPQFLPGLLQFLKEGRVA